MTYKWKFPRISWSYIKNCKLENLYFEISFSDTNVINKRCFCYFQFYALGQSSSDKRIILFLRYEALKDFSFKHKFLNYSSKIHILQYYLIICPQEKNTENMRASLWLRFVCIGSFSIFHRRFLEWGLDSVANWYYEVGEGRSKRRGIMWRTKQTTQGRWW